MARYFYTLVESTYVVRRSAIEAVIGHCKSDGHLDRNFLPGHLGDHINAVMSAVG